MDSAIRAWYFDAGDEARLSEKTTEKNKKSKPGINKNISPEWKHPGPFFKIYPIEVYGRYNERRTTLLSIILYRNKLKLEGKIYFGPSR